MAKSEPDVTVAAGQWRDLVATYAELAGVAVYVQNKGPGALLVYFSASATAPTDNSGMLLEPANIAAGTAGHVWVCAPQMPTTVACGLSD